jgi:hypothetical protein
MEWSRNEKYNILWLLIHSLPSNRSSSVDIVTLELTICDNYKTFINLHTVQITTAHTVSSQSVMSSLVVACWWIVRREWVSYITTDGQSASLSWCQAPIWGLRPDFYYCQTIAVLFMWGALSDERTGLSFTMYNVQYVYILHVILRYSFTNLI